MPLPAASIIISNFFIISWPAVIDADVRKDQEIEAIIQVSDLNYKNFEDARSALGDAGVYDLREYAEKIRNIDQIDFTDWTPTGSKSASRDVYKGDGKKVTISGNLIVQGTTTQTTTSSSNVESNFMILNAGLTGNPTNNAGIRVNRGNQSNVEIRFNETSNQFEFTNDGTTFNQLGSVADSLAFSIALG